MFSYEWEMGLCYSCAWLQMWTSVKSRRMHAMLIKCVSICEAATSVSANSAFALSITPAKVVHTYNYYSSVIIITYFAHSVTSLPAVWLWQRKILNGATTSSRVNFYWYVGHVITFCWTLTIACFLVVLGLGLELGLDLVSCLFVVMHTYLLPM